jgi:hypothetical protein
MSLRERLLGADAPQQTAAPAAPDTTTSEHLDPAIARIDDALSRNVQEADVLVISGANCQPFPVAGRMVGEVRETLAYIMNIDPHATALVNGNIVPRDYVLQQDETLEFTKEGGEKGAPGCKY